MECGLPLAGAEEGRTQSPQPRRFARPTPLGEGRKRHSRQGGSAAAAPDHVNNHCTYVGDGALDVPPPPRKNRGGFLALPSPRRETGAAAAAPAEMPFSGDNLSIPHNDRVDQRRGEVPSFAVSIRGIPKGGRNRNLPPFGVLSLFVHFLFARAKRKWTPPKSVRCRKRDVEDPVPLGGGERRNRSSLNFSLISKRSARRTPEACVRMTRFLLII